MNLDLRDAEITSGRTSITACVAFGNVDVWRVPSDLHGDYRELTDALEARQGELPR